MPWISNHRHKMKKNSKTSRSSSKVVGLGPADLWEFTTLSTNIKKITYIFVRHVGLLDLSVIACNLVLFWFPISNKEVWLASKFKESSTKSFSHYSDVTMTAMASQILPWVARRPLVWSAGIGMLLPALAQFWPSHVMMTGISLS